MGKGNNWILIVSVVVIIAVVAMIFYNQNSKVSLGPGGLGCNGNLIKCQGTGLYSKEACCYDSATTDCLHSTDGNPGCVAKCVAPSGDSVTICEGTGLYGNLRDCCKKGFDCTYSVDSIGSYPKCKKQCEPKQSICYSKSGKDFKCCDYSCGKLDGNGNPTCI